jgi:DNA-binding beta-propeller fold protein YncE
MRFWPSLAILCALPAAFSACYSTNNGVAPPQQKLYFPAGLSVSPGGRALYVVNSDFDLQYDGGTFQAYDLAQLRKDAFANLRAFPAQCPASQNPRPGFDCAPPQPTEKYWRSTVTIGAFGSDVVLSQRTFLDGAGAKARRLFLPVRGSGTVTWIDVADDLESPAADPFALRCGAPIGGRCDSAHETGANATEPGNSRGITLPGEPFGIALSQDESTLLVTHQARENVSLVDTGLRGPQLPASTPSLQFVLDKVPNGGVAAVSIPYSAFATTAAAGASAGPPAPRPAFLMSSRSDPRLSLLRVYSDEADGTSSTLRRPFMLFERSFEVRANAGGADSRGVVLDDSKRKRCEKRAAGDTLALKNCAKVPLRMFVANRSPASVLVGEVGGSSGPSGLDYDADRVALGANIPLSAGPSKLYLAPIVDRDGSYAMRLFVTCFDSATVFVIDPESATIENAIRVGPGPYAMTFDPFVPSDAATFAPAPAADASGLRPYRFAYLASFTDSFIQVIDLDRSDTQATTIEKIVFNLGTPSPPRGAQ